ncbi:MAG: insulinase family protein [Methylococcales symbiont of Hymedesmia sp. n. MRB-2018]|nr:MAG: insulinase family protein [Methylococcales symbiont of Hymedesmia sp. n. MRB-2018]KAF3983455.1 MAG: insulinase family protein [Methylococcales symbiont of Hymedesmia sp. n. MRB-2018]
MHNKWIGFVLLLLSNQVFSATKIEHWQTSQGSPVFYVETKGLPMVDIRIIFDAGSARDGEQYGVASLTSAVLDTGAGQWNADQIAKRFESVGAKFSTHVSRDMASLSLRSLTAEKLLQKSLQTLHAIVSKPIFNEADFQREKQRTLAGLKHREESPATLAKIAFSNILFKDHPYAHPSSGVTETVSEFSVDDLKTFYKQYYVASNAMVVIVGDITKQKAMKIAESLIVNLDKGTKPPALAEVALPKQGINKHIEYPSSQTHVLSGLVGMHRKDPDYFSLYVGNHILGGGGLVSKLFVEVREKRGLAYSAYSYFSPLLRNGTFTMGLQTRNDQTSQAVQVMQQTLSNFVEQGPSEQELLAAKKNLTGGFAMRFDNNSKLTRYVAMIGFYQLTLDYLDLFQLKVEKVTVASIKDAFSRRVKLGYINTITVGAIR